LRTDPLGLAELLGEFGIRTVPSTECSTAEEAARAAAAVGFPWVVKVADAEHRTELGGVRVGLTDAEHVRAAAAELLGIGDSVLVQPQLAGVEVAVGGLRDPDFGPVVLVGLGGTLVEVLDDVGFAVAPLDHAEAQHLLTRLRGYPLLTGARGAEPVDLNAVAATVTAAGNLMCAVEEIAELDLNPLIVTAAGAVAVDWKATPPRP